MGHINAPTINDMWQKKSGRSSPLPSNWKLLRGKQLKRDGYKCQHIREDTGRKCGHKATDVDHYGDPDDHSKLQSLCSFHHDQKTAQQGGKAKRPKIGDRKPKKHPGYM